MFKESVLSYVHLQKVIGMLLCSENSAGGIHEQKLLQFPPHEISGAGECCFLSVPS